MNAVHNGETDHPFVRHAWEEHSGKKPTFIMKIRSRHKSPLDRLTQEAVNILALSRGPAGTDLNAKSEWGQARVPRLTLTMPGQTKPGTNPNAESNPEYKIYLAAVAGAIKAGTKRKPRLAWNEDNGPDHVHVDVESLVKADDPPHIETTEPATKKARKTSETEPQPNQPPYSTCDNLKDKEKVVKEKEEEKEEREKEKEGKGKDCNTKTAGERKGDDTMKTETEKR